MDKATIVAVFSEMAVLLELKGENPFKCRAFENGARAVQGISGDLDDLIAQDRLTAVKGIGKGLAAAITELHTTGKFSEYQALKATIPPGLLEMLTIPGVGPKKVRLLSDELGIQSSGELEYACQENRLLKLKGFGPKSQEKILAAIRFVRSNAGQFLLPLAMGEAVAVLAVLRQDREVLQAEIAGSLRRCKEIVRDIDLVVATQSPATVMRRFVGLPGLKEIIAHGDTKSSVRLSNGIQVDLRCVSEREFPFAWLHFTGSKEHNVIVRGRAQGMGLKLNEYGLFDGDKPLVCADEAAIYRRLDLDYIPPEMREDRGELELAAAHRLPMLIERADLRGAFHAHTVYSDGAATVEAMAAEACKQGLSYLGISDHSQSAFYAHGLKPQDIKRQQGEIDAFNRGSKDFHIFKGIESDILADGALDYDDKTLQSFDFVIASVHSRFKMTAEEMTRRILTAIENPHTTMLGHMTGRLLLSREPYGLDVCRIIDRAAELGKIIELNANPYRLDIDWRHLAYARERGLRVSINPDAHSIAGLSDIEYGIGAARKGGLTRADVVNTMTLKEMVGYLGVSS